jgi:hypothetical protein
LKKTPTAKIAWGACAYLERAVENVFQQRVIWQTQPVAPCIRLSNRGAVRPSTPDYTGRNITPEEIPAIQDLGRDCLLVEFRLETLCESVLFEQMLLKKLVRSSCLKRNQCQNYFSTTKQTKHRHL